MIYLAVIEPVMFWGGLLVYLISLGMFVQRTGEWGAVLRFWQPLVRFTAREFRVNRAGLSLMLVAIVMRFAVYFIV